VQKNAESTPAKIALTVTNLSRSHLFDPLASPCSRAGAHVGVLDRRPTWRYNVGTRCQRFTPNLHWQQFSGTNSLAEIDRAPAEADAETDVGASLPFDDLFTLNNPVTAPTCMAFTPIGSKAIGYDSHRR
jgi:hypothetical protein